MKLATVRTYKFNQDYHVQLEGLNVHWATDPDGSIYIDDFESDNYEYLYKEGEDLVLLIGVDDYIEPEYYSLIDGLTNYDINYISSKSLNELIDNKIITFVE